MITTFGHILIVVLCFCMFSIAANPLFHLKWLFQKKVTPAAKVSPISSSSLQPFIPSVKSTYHFEHGNILSIATDTDSRLEGKNKFNQLELKLADSGVNRDLPKLDPLNSRLLKLDSNSKSFLRAVRFMTFNIHKLYHPYNKVMNGKGQKLKIDIMKDVIQVLETLNPDVAVLEEFVDTAFNDPHWKQFIIKHTYQIAKCKNAPNTRFWDHRYQVIISKFKITHSFERQMGSFATITGYRCMVAAVIDFNTPTINAMNKLQGAGAGPGSILVMGTHLAFGNDNEKKSSSLFKFKITAQNMRSKQYAEILKFSKSLYSKYPRQILMGDLNSEMKEVQGSLGNYFIDSFEAARQVPPVYTYWHGKRLDYVLLTRAIAGDAGTSMGNSLNYPVKRTTTKSNIAQSKVASGAQQGYEYGFPIGSFIYHTPVSDHLPVVADMALIKLSEQTFPVYVDYLMQARNAYSHGRNAPVKTFMQVFRESQVAGSRRSTPINRSG